MRSVSRSFGLNRVGAPDTATDLRGHVSVVSDSNQFRALQHEWNELLGRSNRSSVFLSHEWFESAWQWRQLSARLHLLCYYHDGELSAICPLVQAREGRTRVLEFLSVPDTQLCDLIVQPERHAGAIETFVVELARRRRQWDVLRLRYLPPDAIAISGLLPGLQQHGFRAQHHGATPNPFVALDASWETYYAIRSRSLKKANNLATSRLKKAGKVVVEQLAANAAGAADVDRVVAQAIAVSSRSWKGRTENSLDHAGPQAFIRMLSRRAHERGWLSIWLLHLDGEPVAMEYHLVADGDVYALRSDFDKRCEHISPGSYLFRHLLERLFAQALRRYLMGPGQNRYKYRWTKQAEPVLEGVAFSRTPKGRVLGAWTLDLKPALRRIRHWLYQPLRSSK